MIRSWNQRVSDGNYAIANRQELPLRSHSPLTRAPTLASGLCRGNSAISARGARPVAEIKDFAHQ